MPCKTIKFLMIAHRRTVRLNYTFIQPGISWTERTDLSTMDSSTNARFGFYSLGMRCCGKNFQRFLVFSEIFATWNRLTKTYLETVFTWAWLGFQGVNIIFLVYFNLWPVPILLPLTLVSAEHRRSHT